MKSPSLFQAKRLSSRYAKFLVNRTSRFVLILLSMAAIFSLAMTLLTFAQKQEKESRAGAKAEPATRVERPRKLTPAGKETSKAKGQRAFSQSQELVSRSQDEKAEGRRDGKPREWRMRRARPFIGDVRSLPQTKPIKAERPEREEPELNPEIFVPPDGSPNQGAKEQSAANVSEPAISAPSAPAPPPTSSFQGLDFNTWGNGHPPDTNGDVGPAYYIQTINTSIGIFDKSNGTLVTALTFNTFMSQGHFGNLCDTNNFGDPVVLYDTFEDRWVITDFAFQLSGGAVVNPPGAFQCMAVSRTGDPVSGGWNYFSIRLTDFLNDYPKFGVWNDGIYMSANLFGFPAGGTYAGPRMWAFNKAQLYAGAASVQVVSIDGPFNDFTVIPSNARLQTGTPPAGTPNYFMSTSRFLNAVTVYKFHVDWDHPSLSTLTGPDTPIAATSWANATAPNAASQGGNNLDVLATRAMMQNQYTNLLGVESLWVAHTIPRGTTASPGFAAPRFYQVPVTGGVVGPNITQAATYDPDGANVMSRFAPSVAVDRAGNMALGYSTSNSSTKPAIKYAGRLAGDPINTISQTEQVLIQGTGTQTGNCGGAICTRWGDYSAMTLDPDGCTFWYTNMYYQVDGLNHNTRIGSFQLPQCTTVGQGSIQGTVSSSSGGGPIVGATVNLGSRTTTTGAGGFYSFSGLPAGTYPNMNASFPGYISASALNIVVSEGQITTQNLVLSPGANSACLTDTSQADFQRGVPTLVDLTSSPGDVKLFSVGTLDQQNLAVATSGVAMNATSWVGQTFQPAVTGQLTRADVDLFCSGCTGTISNITVSIRATSGDLPTGPDLATATIPAFSSGAAIFYTANFAAPPTLTAGTRYALVVRPVANPSVGTYAYIISGSNLYANGRWVVSSTAGTSWAGATSGGVARDLGFRTFIKSPTGNLVSGVFDANPHTGGAVTWTTMSWNSSTPVGTSLQFQVAASNSISGPFNFVGPDNTAATFFTTSGASLAQFNGKRYLKYQAFLATTNSAVTPVLNDVTVCFTNTVPTTLTVNPASGTYGGTVSLTGTLTDGVSPLSGQTVAFTLNGNAAGSGVTDGSGVATVNNASLAGINAGTYPTGVGGSFAGNAPFIAGSATNTLTVNKADATIVVTPYNVPFDGNPHTATGTATGVNSESLSGLNLSGTTHTAAGNYTGDPWTFTDVTGNYNNASGTVDDVISQGSSVTTVTVSNAVYDGNPHGGSAAVTGAGLNQSLTVNYAGRNTTVYGPSTTPPTNAGDYTASASFAGDADHTGSSDAKDYSIAPASSVTTVTCPASVVFTGSALTPCAAVATGAGGLNVGLSVSYVNNVNPGVATASASYPGDPNHTGSSGSATFVITAPAYNFVIGDGNAIVGNQVTFWGAQWANANSLSGGSAPSSFKGFANSTSTAPATCGGTWTSDPGNSSGPPATIPEFITVIVSSSVNKNGSVISGNNLKLVIIRTSPGYGTSPGQTGTGTVYSIVCP